MILLFTDEGRPSALRTVPQTAIQVGSVPEIGARDIATSHWTASEREDGLSCYLAYRVADASLAGIGTWRAVILHKTLTNLLAEIERATRRGNSYVDLRN